MSKLKIVSFSYKEIDKIIEKFYKEYNFIPLEYQKNYIHYGIVEFLSPFYKVDKYMKTKTFSCLGKYFEDVVNQETRLIDKISGVIEEDSGEKDNILSRTKFQVPEILKRDPETQEINRIFVINLDVGLGKTITSIVLFRVIKYIYEAIIDNEFEIFNSKIDDAIKDEKNPIKKQLLTQLKKIVDEENNSFNGFDFNLIARKNLCDEFESILSNSNSPELDKSQINLYPSCNKLDKYEGLSSTIGQTLYQVILFNRNNEFDIEQFRKDRYCSSNEHNHFSDYEIESELLYEHYELIYFPSTLFTIDEFGTDYAFFGSEKYNTVICNANPFFAVGLTANKNVPSTTKVYNTEIYKGPRFLKSDSWIKKELEKNHLYSSNSEFSYKFIDISSNDTREKLETLKSSKLKNLTKIKNSLKDMNEFKETLNSQLEKVLNGAKISEKEVDKLLKLIKSYKESDSLTKIFNRQDHLIKEIEEKLRDFSKLVKDTSYNNIVDVFNTSHLNYLLENNTIIILDNEHDSIQIKELKEYFKENKINVYNGNNFRNMSGKGNVLVGKVSEISKGLNLQHFDSILFWYIDSITVNDIYQGIGRLDRIGTTGDKEIILLSYDQDEKKINDIVDKKDEYNSSLSFTTTQTISSFGKEKLGEIYRELESNISTESLEMLNKVEVTIESSYEEKDKLKKKLDYIHKNKTIFKKMISDINKRFENAQKTINSLVGSNDLTTTKSYVESIVNFL